MPRTRTRLPTRLRSHALYVCSRASRVRHHANADPPQAERRRSLSRVQHAGGRADRVQEPQQGPCDSFESRAQVQIRLRAGDNAEPYIELFLVSFDEVADTVGLPRQQMQSPPPMMQQPPPMQPQPYGYAQPPAVGYPPAAYSAPPPGAAPIGYSPAPAAPAASYGAPPQQPLPPYFHGAPLAVDAAPAAGYYAPAAPLAPQQQAAPVGYGAAPIAYAAQSQQTVYAPAAPQQPQPAAPSSYPADLTSAASRSSYLPTTYSVAVAAPSPMAAAGAGVMPPQPQYGYAPAPAGYGEIHCLFFALCADSILLPRGADAAADANCAATAAAATVDGASLPAGPAVARDSRGDHSLL